LLLDKTYFSYLTRGLGLFQKKEESESGRKWLKVHLEGLKLLVMKQKQI